MRSLRNRTPGNRRNCQGRFRITILVKNQVSAINISLGIIKSVVDETHFSERTNSMSH